MSSLDLLDSHGTENESENFLTAETTQDDSDIELSAQEVIQRLQQAWMNELFAPELLEPKIEIVDCLLGQIKSAGENLEKLDRSHFGIPIYKMELQRVRFMIASYLRLRLQKIQKHPMFFERLRILGHRIFQDLP